MSSWSCRFRAGDPEPESAPTVQSTLDNPQLDTALLGQLIRSVEAIRERHRGKVAFKASSLLDMLHDLKEHFDTGDAEAVAAWRSRHSDDAWKLLKLCLIESGQIKALEGDALVEQFRMEFAGEIKERK